MAISTASIPAWRPVIVRHSKEGFRSSFAALPWAPRFERIEGVGGSSWRTSLTSSRSFALASSKARVPRPWRGSTSLLAGHDLGVRHQVAGLLELVEHRVERAGADS